MAIPNLTPVDPWPTRKLPQDTFDSAVKTAMDQMSVMVGELNDSFIPAANEATEAINTLNPDLPAIRDAPNQAAAAAASAAAAAGSSGDAAEEVENAKAEVERAKAEADRAEEAADRAVSIADVGPATADKIGLTKPDMETIEVDEDGTLSVPTFAGLSVGLVPAATSADAKKVLLGDGTWGSAEDDAAAMTISQDLILTADSPRTLVLKASASGLSVLLPNHATLPEGTTFHIIVRPLEDIQLCDSTGQPIKAYPVLSASSAIRVQLVDASTGLWALSEYKSGSTSDAQGKPGLNIGELTIFSSANIFSISVASLSESKAIACYNDSGNSNYGTACVLSISGTTVSVGEPTVFNSAYTNGISVAPLSESKAIVCYFDGGNSSHGTASVLSVSGTTVSAESKNDISLTKTTEISVASLSESKAVVCYSDSGNSNYGTACVLSISGTTVRAGNKTVFNSASTSYISIATLSESKVIVCCSRGNDRIAKVLSISGTTVSVGGETVFNSDKGTFVNVAALSESKAVVCYNTKSKGTACVLSISGTTVSAGSETTFSSEYFNEFLMAAISEGKAIVCCTSNSKGTAYVMSISGTTVSVGGETVFSFSATNHISGAVLPSSTKKIVTAFYDDTYGVGKTCAMLLA